MPGKNRAATSPDYCLAETPRAGGSGIAVLQMFARTKMADVTGIAGRDTAVDHNASTAPHRRCLGQGATKGIFCLSCGAELPGKCWLRFPRDWTGHEQAHFPSQAFLTFFARPYTNSRISPSLGPPH